MKVYNNPLCIWSKNPVFFQFPMFFDPTLKGKSSESTSFSTPFRAGSRRKASKCKTGYNPILFSLLVLFSACSDSVQSGKDLSDESVAYMVDLGVLDEDEVIIYFYTSLNNKVSGNLISNRRLASYWQNGSNEDHVQYAYYEDIKSIKIAYGDGFEFTSYLLVERINGAVFKVYLNDTKANINQIYEFAINQWKLKKGSASS